MNEELMKIIFSKLFEFHIYKTDGDAVVAAKHAMNGMIDAAKILTEFALSDAERVE